MHSFIIIGSSGQDRIQKIEELLKSWHIDAIDQVTLNSEGISIGIKNIRDLQARITLKPYTSPFTAAIVKSAHLLTIEAQQALLKTLEEPPRTTRIILETPMPDVLLPTILSRCQRITASNSVQEDLNHEYQKAETFERARKILSGARLKLVDSIAIDREHTAIWIEEALTDMRHELLSHYFSKTKNKLLPLVLAKNLRSLLAARSQLAANVNPKLVLDHVFLSLA